MFKNLNFWLLLIFIAVTGVNMYQKNENYKLMARLEKRQDSIIKYCPEKLATRIDDTVTINGFLTDIKEYGSNDSLNWVKVETGANRHYKYAKTVWFVSHFKGVPDFKYNQIYSDTIEYKKPKRRRVSVCCPFPHHSSGYYIGQSIASGRAVWDVDTLLLTDTTGLMPETLRIAPPTIQWTIDSNSPYKNYHL